MMLVWGCNFVFGMLGIVWVGFGVGGVWQSTAGVFLARAGVELALPQF